MSRKRMARGRGMRPVVRAAAVAAGLAAGSAPGATWVGTTGDWFAAANWSPAAVPVAGTAAVIANGGTAQIASGASAAAGELRLGGGTTAGDGTVALAAGTLTTATQYLGYGASSTGTITQTGGVNNVNGAVYVGYDAGTHGLYTLNGGTLTGTDLQVKVGASGTGTFGQSAGTLTSDALWLGSSLTGTGSYVLSGGLCAPSYLYLWFPTSTFTQTGGTLSTGEVDQTAGSVQVPSLAVGGVGSNVGRYSMAQGTLTADSLVVGSGGSFTLTQGGQVSAGSITVTGGRFSATTGKVSTPSLNVSGGTFSVAGSGVLSAAGGVTVTGGTFTVSKTSGLVTPSLAVSGGVVSLPYDAVLDSGSLAPTTAGMPSLSQTGGTMKLANGYLGTTAGSVAFTPSATGPNVSFVNLYVGYAAGSTATVNQTGGTFNPSNLYLGRDPAATATYTLGGGTLGVTNEYVGTTGSGTFTQTGGTHDISGLFQMGSHGRYELQGGTFHAGVFLFDDGSTFVRTGGTFSIGAFYQDGGSVTAGAPGGLFADPLVLNGQRYTLGWGTLRATSMTLGPGGVFASYGIGVINIGSIALNGGTASFNQVVLDSGAPVPSVATPPGVAPPSLQLNAGTLAGTAIILGATSATASFTQSAPVTFAPTDLYVTTLPNQDATYVLAGEGVITGGTVHVGGAGRGTFVQSGGTNAATTVSIGAAGGRSGYYQLWGGQLTASAVNVVLGTLEVGSGATASPGRVGNAANVVLDGPAGGAGAGVLNCSTFTQDAAGNLLVDIGGPTAQAGYPLLHADGGATLAGTLTVAFDNGFVPAAGETFTFLTASTVGGTFSSVVSPDDVALGVSYSPTAVTLVVLPEPGGPAVVVAAGAAMLSRRRGGTGRQRPSSGVQDET